MATRSRPNAQTRAPLNRDRVLRTAIDMADANGIESLSMRSLGRELGVEAMSIYNHVANKEDLLDGIADIVVDEIELPADGEDWRSANRRRASSAREMLSRHPWAGALIDSRTRPSPARLRYPEAVVANLRQAGFSVEMAIHAFLTLDAYIYGFAVQQQSLPSGTPEELVGIAEVTLSELPADRYPYLRETITDYVLAKGYSYAEGFDFGLNLILDGLERARDAELARGRRERRLVESATNRRSRADVHGAVRTRRLAEDEPSPRSRGATQSGHTRARTRNCPRLATVSGSASAIAATCTCVATRSGLPSRG